MNQQPIKTELNNGIITAKAAMPLKDLTSNNEAEFSMSRRLFNRSYINTSNFAINQTGKSVIERESLGLSQKVIIDGPKSTLQKKWIGGNRDASNIISRRKISNTGNILSKTGTNDFSFKNIVDNNTAADARIRCRAGGYRVPPGVTQKNVIPVQRIPTTDPSTYYRIIATGLNYISTSLRSSVNKYDPKSLIQTPIMTLGLTNAGRSYNLLTITRSTGKIAIYPKYDVFGTAGQVAALAAALSVLDSSVIVIIFTYDEPKNNVNISPSTTIDTTNLIYQFKRCGASSTFPAFINYRGAYVLVGIPGIGVNNGLERYRGDTLTLAGDPTALIDIRISYFNGNYTYISG